MDLIIKTTAMIIKSRRDRTLNHKVYDVLYREQLPCRQINGRR